MSEFTREMKKVFVFLLLVLCVSACRSENTARVNHSDTNPVIAENSSNIGQANIRPSPAKTALYGEITDCTPEKFGRGAMLVISLKTPNGGYLAIEREGKKPDYFLLSAPENSEEQKNGAAVDSLPFWQVETLKTLRRIELNSSEARTVNLSKLNKQGEGKAELIFGQSGWYKILLSDENFEQDDPVITGQCRVYFDGASTGKKTGQISETSGDEIINWEITKENLYFQMELRLSNNQPTAFSLNGSRQFTTHGAETANDCEFTIEKGKNSSDWQTAGGKTIIVGKNDSGDDFKMFIEKMSDGFLIDTSAAAESCFNVGMPGNILLTKTGSKYIGNFITSKSK